MKKKVFILVICLFVINVITTTYSLYESNITVPIEISLAPWVIKVNDKMIGQESEIIINDIIWENNDNIKDGKTAPGAVGYFDLEIVPENVGVAFTYTFIIDYINSEENNFKIASIESENTNIIKEEDNKYSGLFSIEDIKNNKTTKVRFNLIWENNEEKNELDSKYIGVGNKINIPITMNFSQYLDE